MRSAVITAVAFFVVLLGTTIPSPLFPLYERGFHIPTVEITILFGLYALGVVIGLLAFGRKRLLHLFANPGCRFRRTVFRLGSKLFGLGGAFSLELGPKPFGVGGALPLELGPHGRDRLLSAALGFFMERRDRFLRSTLDVVSDREHGFLGSALRFFTHREYRLLSATLRLVAD